MPASDCGVVRLGRPLAARLGGHLAARAPDEADDRVGEVARRAQAVGAGVLLHQQLGVGHQLRPGGGRGGDAGRGELVLAVPDAAHAAEPRHGVVLAADGVVGQVARDQVRAVRPGLHVGGDVGQGTLAGYAGGVGIAQLGDVRAVLAAGQGVRPVRGPVGPRDPVDRHLGLGVGRELLVELGHHAVHPGHLGRDGGAHPPHGEHLGGGGGGSRRRGRAAGAAGGRGGRERDSRADGGC